MDISARSERPKIPAISGVCFADELERPVTDATSILDRIRDPGLQDVQSADGLHGGLVRHVMAGRGPFVWVQDSASRSNLGVPASGSFVTGNLTSPLLVRARSSQDALWAMEEAVKAGVNVVGEVEATAKALDFTATRRFEMFAQAIGVTCFLARTGASRSDHASSARWRWRVSSHPSATEPYDPHAPGLPRWSLELLRSRTCAPGQWIIEPDRYDDGEDHRLRVVPPLASRNVDSAPSQDARIIPFRNVRAA